MKRQDLTGLTGWLTAGILSLAVLGCDSGNVTVDNSEEQSKELQAFREAPPRPVNSGAHRENDPHADLSAQKMAQVALQHLDEGRAGLALETLHAAIGKYPEDAMLLGIRASLFMQQQQTSLALADLNRAVELNPHDPILLTNRAQAFRQFRRIEDALRDLDSALEIEPRFVAAYFNRGGINFEAEKYALALVDFNRCIELEPEAPAAYFNRASTYEALGDRQRAIADLQHFLTLQPEESWAQIARDMLRQWDPELS